MTVSELTTALRAGALKKLFVKSSEPDVLGFINSGIMDLYTKFPLWRDSIPITPVVGVKDYFFGGYDTNVPFDSDLAQLMLIGEVTATDIDDNMFTFIPTNNSKPQTFSTPVYNSLRINKEYETYTLDVEVRLAPLPLTRTRDDIPLPPQLIELLTLYVAYKGHNSVSADIKGENNTYYVRYNSEVREMIDSGQYPLDDLDYSSLTSRGFM
jgi:hypothetical protein